MYPVAILSVTTDHHRPTDVVVRPVSVQLSSSSQPPTQFPPQSSDQSDQVDQKKQSLSLSELNSSLVGKKLVLFAKRGSGKSWLVASVYRAMKLKNKFSKVFVVSPTEDICPFYRDIIPEGDIRIRLTEDVIVEINSLGNNSFVILDDCIYSRNWRTQCDMLRDTFNNPNVTVIMTEQYPLFSPKFVGVFDYLLYGQEDCNTNISRLYNYLPCIGQDIEKNQFHTLMRDSLNTFEFLMFANKCTSTDLDINTGSKTVLVGDLEKVPIRRFDLGNMCVNPHIVIINPDHDANANLIKSLHYHQASPFTHAVVFTKFNKHRYDDFTQNIYPSIIRLEGLIKSIRQTLKNKQSSLATRILIVFDHMMTPTNIKRAILQEIIFNGRHYGVTTVIIESFPVTLSPEIRCNLDYVFIKGVSLISLQKRLYEHYAGFFPNFTTFRHVLEGITREKCYLTVINRGNQNHYNVTDKIAYTPEIVTKVEKLPELELPSVEQINRATIADVKSRIDALVRELKSLRDIVDSMDSYDEDREYDVIPVSSKQESNVLPTMLSESDTESDGSF